MTLDEPGIRHQRRSLCRCLGETWTAPTLRPQRGQPHVDGPLGGAFPIPRPMAVVDYSCSETRAMIVEEEGTGGRRCREHGIFLESLSDLRSSLADFISTTQGPCHEALSFPHRHPRDPRAAPRSRLCRSA